MKGFWPPVILFTLAGSILVVAATTVLYFHLPGVWAVFGVFAFIGFLSFLDYQWGARGESPIMNAWIALAGLIGFYTVNGLVFGDAGSAPLKWGLAIGLPTAAFFLIAGIRKRGDG